MLSLLLAAAALLQSATPAQTLPQDEPISPPAVVYPAEARRARIEGTVQLQVSVDATGHVTHVEAISGPVALRQAAVDAYSNAQYRPLLHNGHPAPATITTAVNFHLDVLPPSNDQELEARFLPVHRQCQLRASEHAPHNLAKDAEAALPDCQEAVELASHFSEGAQLDLRASALNDLALVYMTLKRYPDAVSIADQAIDLVATTNHPHTPAAATAYITRCEARSLAKDISGAMADCGVAEDTLNTLIADQAAPDQRTLDRTANYRGELRETYELHAILAEKLHNPAEARRLRALEKSI